MHEQIALRFVEQVVLQSDSHDWRQLNLVPKSGEAVNIKDLLATEQPGDDRARPSSFAFGRRSRTNASKQGVPERQIDCWSAHTPPTFDREGHQGVI